MIFYYKKSRLIRNFDMGFEGVQEDGLGFKRSGSVSGWFIFAICSTPKLPVVVEQRFVNIKFLKKLIMLIYNKYDPFNSKSPNIFSKNANKIQIITI